jgi:acetyl esterase/lipase
MTPILLSLLLLSSADVGCPKVCEGGTQCADPCPGYAAACDVPYGPEPWQTLDVYLPPGWDPGTNTQPTIFYVHGGGWAFGDKRCTVVADFVLTMLSLDYPVVSVNYLLTDGGQNPGTWPQPIMDVKRALAWVRGAGGDAPLELPGCVVATGTSAGGHLVALLGATWDVAELAPEPPVVPDLYRPDLVVPVSGPTDLFVLGCQGSCSPASCSDCFLGQVCFDLGGPGMDSLVEVFVGCEWGPQQGVTAPGPLGPRILECGVVRCANPPALPLGQLSGDPFLDASPIAWVDGSDPACFQIGAECDPLVHSPQLSAYHNALQTAGVDSGLFIETTRPWACGHAFGIYGSAGTATAVDQAVQGWWPSQPSFGTGSFCR